MLLLVASCNQLIGNRIVGEFQNDDAATSDDGRGPAPGPDGSLDAATTSDAVDSGRADSGLDGGTSTEAAPPEPDTDARADGSGGFDAATADAEASAQPQPVEPRPVKPQVCCTVYVGGANAKDSNDGCSPDTSKATISGALSSFDSVTLQQCGADADVQVCNGEYVETNLALTLPVSLIGGVGCAGGEQFDATVVKSAPDSSNEEALRIAGAGVDEQIEVLGFTFVGRDPAQVASLAVHVTGGARPNLHDNVLLGGAGKEPSEGPGSIGLSITGGAAPDVHHNVIQGGSGSTNKGLGSTGVLVDGSAPTIHHNLIDGGSGNTDDGVGSVGVFVDDATPYIHHNQIRGGSGTGPRRWGSNGLRIEGDSTLSVRNVGSNPIEYNTIYSGTGTATGLREDREHDDDAAAFAFDGDGRIDLLNNELRGELIDGEVRTVHLKGGSGHRLMGNRIFGGSSRSRDARALHVGDDTSNVLVRGNWIHGGLSHLDEASKTIVIEDEASNTQLLANTIYSGIASTGEHAEGLHVDVADGELSVIGNLFVGTTASKSRAVRTDLFCGAEKAFSKLVANVFVHQPVRFAVSDVCSATIDSAAELNAYVDCTSPDAPSDCTPAGRDDFADNFWVSDTCDAPASGCIAIAACGAGASEQTCLSALFETWSAPITENAAAPLLSEPGESTTVNGEPELFGAGWVLQEASKAALTAAFGTLPSICDDGQPALGVCVNAPTPLAGADLD